AIEKPDKNKVFQECTVTNGATGECEVTLNTQAYAVQGLHKAEIMLYRGQEAIAVTGMFTYNARKGVLNDQAIESENDWQAFHQVVTDADKARTDAQTYATQAQTSALQAEQN